MSHSSPSGFSELCDHVSTLITKCEHKEALAVIADAIDLEPGPLPVSLRLEQVRALAGLERFQKADEALAPLLNEEAHLPLDKARALELEARITLETGGDLAYVIDTARRAATIAERLSPPARDLAVRARGVAAIAFAHKRAPLLAQKELDQAEAAAGETPELVAFEASVLLEFDRRVEALERYKRCAELATQGREQSQRWAQLGQAHVARLVGDFDHALALLEAMEPLGTCDLMARAEKVQIRLAQRRWPEALIALDDLIRASPHADSIRTRRMDRAHVLHQLGRREQAMAACASLVSESQDDAIGKQARRYLRITSAPDRRTLPRRRLEGFGSVTQLRDHCGPACCELLLRYYGAPADQVEIARRIKRANAGTPIYAMREYLEAAGLHVRRVEAALPLIKALLDARIPLILDEEYSSSHHVALAIGYDDEREILEVQDPMTHEIRETPYEDLPKLLKMANHGTIVAVPSTNKDLIETLDNVGALDSRYLTLTDGAFSALDAEDFDQAEELVDESIATREDYEFSWICKFHLARHRMESDPTAQRSLEDVLAKMLELWPDDEWPQQYVGSVAWNAGRHQEALRAYRIARDRDPEDGRNWAMIGDCLIALGREEEAMEPLRQTLIRMPWHVRAHENLAGLAEERGHVGKAEALNEVGLEINPENPFNHEVAARIASRRGDYERAVLECDQALALAPDRGFAVVLRARALAKLQRVEDAIQALTAALEDNPADPRLATELADLLYAEHRYSESAAVCEAMLAKDPQALAARAILGASWVGDGRIEAGVELLERVLGEKPNYAWVHAQLGVHFGRMNKNTAAVQSLAAAVGFSDGVRHRLALAEALLRAGAREEAAHQVRATTGRRCPDREDVLRGARLLTLAEGFNAARAHIEQAANDGDGPGASLLRAIGEESELVPGSQRRPPLATQPLDALPTQLTEAQRWVMAISGILRTRNQEAFDLLGGSPRPSGAAAAVLQGSWRITRPDQLIDTLRWLRQEGHRVRFAARTGRPEREFLAWDFCRMSSLAGWGYAACLLDQSTAWEAMLEAARGLQFILSSWRELGDSYLAGRRIWLEESNDASDELVDSVEQLLSSGGVWRELDWQVALGGTLAPEAPVIELIATESPALDHQIARVYAGGADPWSTTLRVILPPGTYRTRLALEGAVELLAEGPGVALESEDGAALIELDHTRTGLLLRGLELRNRPGNSSAEASLAWVDGGLLRLESCRITAAGVGIELRHDTALVQVEDSAFEDCQTAVQVRRGHAKLEHCEIALSRGDGLEVESRGTLHLRDCHLHHGFGAGINVAGELELTRSKIESNQLVGVVITAGGSAHLVRSEFRGGGDEALVLHTGARRLTAEGCVFKETGKSSVRIGAMDELASFEDCRFGSTAEHHLCLAPGRHTSLRNCELSDAGRASVEVTGAPESLAINEGPHLDNCEIRNSGGGVRIGENGILTLDRTHIHNLAGIGLELSKKARLHASHCRIQGAAQIGLELLAESAAWLTDCELEDSPAAVTLSGASTLRWDSGSIRRIESRGFSLTDTALLFLSHLQISVNSESALDLQSGSRALLESVEIDGGGLFIEDAQILIAGCSLTAGRTLGLSASLDGMVALARTEITSHQAIAVEACDQSQVILFDCKGTGGSVALLARGNGILEARGGHFSSGHRTAVEAHQEGRITLRGVELTAQQSPAFETQENGQVLFAEDSPGVIPRLPRDTDDGVMVCEVDLGPALSVPNHVPEFPELPLPTGFSYPHWLIDACEVVLGDAGGITLVEGVDGSLALVPEAPEHLATIGRWLKAILVDSRLFSLVALRSEPALVPPTNAGERAEEITSQATHRSEIPESELSDWAIRSDAAAEGTALIDEDSQPRVPKDWRELPHPFGASTPASARRRHLATLGMPVADAESPSRDFVSEDDWDLFGQETGAQDATGGSERGAAAGTNGTPATGEDGGDKPPPTLRADEDWETHATPAVPHDSLVHLAGQSTDTLPAIVRGTDPVASPPQRWVLGVGAIRALASAQNLDILGGCLRPQNASRARAVLRREFGVECSVDLIPLFEQLLGGDGENRNAKRLAKSVKRSLTSTTNGTSVAQTPGQQGRTQGLGLAPQARIEECLAYVERHRDEFERIGLMGWDLARIVEAAELAFSCSLLSSRSSFYWARKAALALRSRFKSWSEFATNYERGRTLHGLMFGRQPSVRLGTSLAVLLTQPSSPWRELPWDLPELELAEAPTLGRHELSVGEGQQFQTIQAALNEASPGSVIRVAPGTYHETLELDRDVEIVAEGPLGSVLLEGTRGVCLRVAGANVRLEQVVFQGSEEAPDGIYISSGYVHAERCVIQAASFGVMGTSTSTEISLMDCAIRACTVGVALVGGGALSLERTEISDPQDCAIRANSVAQLVLARTGLYRSAGSGIELSHRATAFVIDSDFASNRGPALKIDDDSSVELLASTLRDGPGPQVLGRARIQAEKTQLPEQAPSELTTAPSSSRRAAGH